MYTVKSDTLNLVDNIYVQYIFLSTAKRGRYRYFQNRLYVGQLIIYYVQCITFYSVVDSRISTKIKWSQK